MRRAARWIRALTHLAAPALVTGCALALGVQSDVTVAVSALCGCPSITGIYSNCEKTLGDRLSLAPADVRASWLEAFTTDDCSHCPSAYKCFYKAPLCVAKGDACDKVVECCSFPLATCTNGLCK